MTTKIKRRLMVDMGTKTWCEMKAKVSGDDPDALRFSLTGAYGYLQREADVEADARANMEELLSDPTRLGNFMQTNAIEVVRAMEIDDLSIEAAAAQVVIDMDGPHAGIDVHDEMYDTDSKENWFLVTDGCGCIHSTLEAWFPDAKPWVEYHLNDMKPGCAHQMALGWRHDRTIHLLRKHATSMQLDALDRQQRGKEALARDKLVVKQIEALFWQFPVERAGTWNHGVLDTLCACDLSQDLAQLWDARQAFPGGIEFEHSPNAWVSVAAIVAATHDGSSMYAAVELHLPVMRADLKEKLKRLFQHELTKATDETRKPFRNTWTFPNCVGAPCPECGALYSYAWHLEPLPAGLLAWFDALPTSSTENV